MANVRFKALDAEGRFVSGRLTDIDPRRARERLLRSGHVVLEIADEGAAVRRGFRLGAARRPKPAEVTIFLRDLAMVIRAGLPVDAGLRLLSGEEAGSTATVADDLRRSISGGASLAEAMSSHPDLFGPDLVTMVRVAEAAGTLDRVLDSAAAARTRSEEAMETIASSLRYPAFLLVAATGVLLFFLIVVVPQFAGVLRDFGAVDGGVVGAVLGLSDFVVDNGRALTVAVAVAVAALWLALRDPRRRRRIGAVVLRLPGPAGLVTLRRAAAFCDGLSTLLGNGVPLSEALAVLADAHDARENGVARVAERVRRGERLATAIEAERLLPVLAVDMLRIGEETSELASVARRISDFYEGRLTQRLRRLTAVIGPAAIVCIAVMVGGLIVSILSALLSIDRLVL